MFFLAVQIPLKPPRPSSSLLNSHPSENGELLVVLEEQTCQEKPKAELCPVPKPRSKGNLKLIVRDTENTTQDNQEEGSQSRTEGDAPSIQLVSLLDENLLHIHMATDSMDTDKSQSSIESRIKAFELQANTDISGLIKKPEISPRSLAPKPSVGSKKPVVAPKPGVSRASGDWNAWTESKIKAVSQERENHPQESGSNITFKPELPKKPKPSMVKSHSNGLDAGSMTTTENSEGQKKSPIPAPRPFIPKKSHSFENPILPLLPLKPISATPKLSGAAQSLSSHLSSTSLQSTPSVEGDLISFDDNIIPLKMVGAVQERVHSESGKTENQKRGLCVFK